MRQNYDLNDDTAKKLQEIAQFYGINKTAAISVLITEKYIELQKHKKANSPTLFDD